MGGQPDDGGRGRVELGLAQAYERRLPLAIYLPYTLLMAGNLLLLNGSIMAVSVAFAAPVHARLDREGKRAELLRLLRRYNLPRLIASAASTLLLSALLAQVLGV